MTRQERLTVAELVRNFRKRAGLTLEELSAAAGVSARTLSNVERGVSRRPRTATLGVLADVLRLSPEERLTLMHAVRASRIAERAEGRPTRVAEFVGRRPELSAITARLYPTGGNVLITGPDGIGRAALALRAAAELQARYPSGLVRCDLRAPSWTPGPARQAMRQVLLGLGTRPEDVPRDASDLVSVYGDVLRSRRALVLLERAADPSELAALFVDGSASAVLMTSRKQAGIDGVMSVGLGPLAPEESVALIASLLAAGGRPDSGRLDDLESLADACSHWPLALRICAARLCSRPRWSIEFMVARLRTAVRPASLLDTTGDGLAAAVAVSVDQLSDPARTVLRAMSLVSGADLTAELAAVAAGTDQEFAEQGLAELVAADLVHQGPSGRFVQHAALRTGSRELAADDDTGYATAPEQWSASVAADRVTTWLLTMAISAARAVDGNGSPEFVTQGAALGWLSVERDNWLPALEYAAAGRFGLLSVAVTSAKVYAERAHDWDVERIIDRLSAGGQ